MSIITEITPSPRRTGRFDVLADGRPFATLSLDQIERLHLHVGVLVSPMMREAVEREAQALATFDRAANLLALRARATGELRRALIRRGEPEPFVDAALERLTRLGLLDDAAFARQFVHAKATGAGHSTRRLRTELARRGVAREIADAAIVEVFADESIDREAIIDEVARKKLRTLGRFDPLTRRRRLYAFLARRGYDSDDIARVIRKLVTGEAESDVDRGEA